MTTAKLNKCNYRSTKFMNSTRYLELGLGLKYSTVQYSTVGYSTVQYIPITPFTAYKSPFHSFDINRGVLNNGEKFLLENENGFTCDEEEDGKREKLVNIIYNIKLHHIS